MSSTRHNAGFQYRLRFFHKCRSLGGPCDPGQIDRLQVQGSALESTCGAPIIVVLVRYRHDPESGLSRECQRVILAPSAPPFAVKVVVVPADQVLSYMDQPLLQQPRLMDSEGRCLIEGPDVSPDGCIYVTPLEKNGIAHLNNFCMSQPYTGAHCGQATGGCCGGGGLGQLHPPGDSRCAPEATRRMRAMLGPSVSEGGVLSGCSEVLQDSADLLNSNGELCLLVQLLRRDPQRHGKWFAYDIPHLVSRPFQVVPRGALPELHASAGPSPLHHSSRQQTLAPGRSISSARHSVGQSLGVAASASGPESMHPRPEPFMSPQYKRSQGAVGFGPVPTAGLASYASGPGLPTRMSGGFLGSPNAQEVGSTFRMGGREPVFGGMGAMMGPSSPLGAGTSLGLGPTAGSPGAPGPLADGAGPGAAIAGGSFMGDRGGGGAQSSMSTESPSAGAASQRGPRACRRSCLSKDSSHDDSSVGAPMTTSGATAVAGLRTPSITSGAEPGTSGAMRAAAQQAAATAAAAAAAAAASADLGVASGGAPGASPPFSPQPSRLARAVGVGMGPGTGAASREVLAAPSIRTSEEGRLVPVQLRQAPSATLLDLNITELLNDIQPQPLLIEDMMDLEGPPKRVRSNTTTSDVAAFMSDYTSSHAITGSPKWVASPVRQMDGFHSRSCHMAVAGRSAGGGGCGASTAAAAGGNAFVQFEGHASRTDSWSTDLSPEQLMDLRKQSTGFSGTHFAVANASSSAPCSGPPPEPCRGAGGGGGSAGAGGASRGSSASQLELLVQLLGQPGAMQDALDRMDMEQLHVQPQQQPDQQPVQLYDGAGGFGSVAHLE